jgi:hypothetical protein
VLKYYLGISLMHFPKVQPRIFRTGTSCHLGLVVLVALMLSAFTFLNSFNLPIIQEARKLVYTNSLQIKEDFRKF